MLIIELLLLVGTLGASYYAGHSHASRTNKKKLTQITGQEVKKIEDLSYDNFKEVMESDYKEEDYEKDFTIEHYPESGSYYAKYKKYYLSKHYTTGIVEKKDQMHWAHAQKSEDIALKLINLFKEQSLKKNVTTIKVKKT